MTTNTETTRRAILGVIAAAPAASIPALGVTIAGAVTSPDLVAAIDAHKAAHTVLKAHYGPEDIPEDICDAETDAARDVALTPAANESELLAKLRYLLDYERTLFGGPQVDHEFGLVAVAFDLHVNPAEYEDEAEA